MRDLEAMRTSIATVSISGDFREKLEAIAAAGFDGIEIFENDFIAFDRGPAEAAAIVAVPLLRRRREPQRVGNGNGLDVDLLTMALACSGSRCLEGRGPFRRGRCP